jgi:hypothetical protein
MIPTGTICVQQAAKPLQLLQHQRRVFIIFDRVMYIKKHAPPITANTNLC